MSCSSAERPRGYRASRATSRNRRTSNASVQGVIHAAQIEGTSCNPESAPYRTWSALSRIADLVTVAQALALGMGLGSSGGMSCPHRISRESTTMPSGGVDEGRGILLLFPRVIGRLKNRTGNEGPVDPLISESCGEKMSIRSGSGAHCISRFSEETSIECPAAV